MLRNTWSDGETKGPRLVHSRVYPRGTRNIGHNRVHGKNQAPMMTDNPTLLDYAEATLASVRALIDKMRAPLSTPDRPRAALFLTIAEQFEAAIRLGRAGLGTHGAVHVRSMLEALVSMKLLGLLPGYADQMRFEKLRGEKKLYENILTDHDIPAEQRAPLQKLLAVCKLEYDALFARGLRPRRISEDFGPAGLAGFIAPYTMLCGFSHNDLAILAARHQGDQGMTYRTEVPDDMMLSIYTVAITVIVSAAQPLRDIALFPEGHFDRVFQEMNHIWGTFLQQAGA